VNFQDGSERTVTFLADPTVTQSGNKLCFDFPVMLNFAYGEEKILRVTNNQLMKLILAEDEKAPLIGRTFCIKAIGDAANCNWVVSETEGTIKSEFEPIFKSQRDQIKRVQKDTEYHKAKTAKILGGFDEILDRQQVAIARLRKMDDDRWKRLIGK
jgi:hypothetical protein